MAILKEATIETVNNMCSFLEQDSFVDTALEHGRAEIEVINDCDDVRINVRGSLYVYEMSNNAIEWKRRIDENFMQCDADRTPFKRMAICAAEALCAVRYWSYFVDDALEHGRSEIEVTHKFRDVKVKALMVLSVYKGC